MIITNTSNRVCDRELLLATAYRSIQQLLPPNDCEDYYAVKVSQKYYDYWRPSQPRIILLAESHVFTDTTIAQQGPPLNAAIAKELDYHGPLEYTQLIYCLTYGERDAMMLCDDDNHVATDNNYDDNDVIAKNNNDKNNKTTAAVDKRIYQSASAKTGTPQFWELFCTILGWDPSPLSKNKNKKNKHQYKDSSNNDKNNNKKTSTKSRNNTTSAIICTNDHRDRMMMMNRLRYKLKILRELQRRGIWLLDASIVGWYRCQRRVYAISKKRLTVHKQNYVQPWPSLKIPTLLLSWELYLKHVVRNAADEGYLQLFLPIGKSVEQAITKQRFQEACGGGGDGGSSGHGQTTTATTMAATTTNATTTTSPTTRSNHDDTYQQQQHPKQQPGSKGVVYVADAVPAPNAMLEGGYRPVLQDIRDLILQFPASK